MASAGTVGEARRLSSRCAGSTGEMAEGAGARLPEGSLAGSQLLLPPCAESVLELMAPHLPPGRPGTWSPGETGRTVGVLDVVTNMCLSEAAVKCRVTGKARWAWKGGRPETRMRPGESAPETPGRRPNDWLPSIFALCFGFSPLPTGTANVNRAPRDEHSTVFRAATGLPRALPGWAGARAAEEWECFLVGGPGVLSGPEGRMTDQHAGWWHVLCSFLQLVLRGE